MGLLHIKTLEIGNSLFSVFSVQSYKKSSFIYQYSKIYPANCFPMRSRLATPYCNEGGGLPPYRGVPPRELLANNINSFATAPFLCVAVILYPMLNKIKHLI
ncbi:MAG: hypothetical protein IKD10_02355 [Lentisphaeria bacterium]|nr:hypothetical protein [Lentisphaeria bacterium]